jgi:hypothetical protein
MPIPAFNALGLGASLVGGLIGNRAASRAARAQREGAAQAQGYLSSAAQGFSPYTQAGEQNLNRLNQLMGGDYSGFTSGPDYQAAYRQGLQALDRSAAARGSMYSGGADADRMSFASDLASQTLGQYRNALSGLAGMGLQAQGQVADIYGQQAGIASGLGNAMAQNQAARGQNWQNMLGNLVGFGSDYLGGRGVWGSAAPDIQIAPIQRMTMPITRPGG